MYVRKKKGSPYDYYQLVESRRVDGKPRQKVLLHLGDYSSVDDALKAWPRKIKRLRRDAEKERGLVPEDYESERGQRMYYRRALGVADSLERQADELEVKLGRLRELRASGVVPTTNTLY